jgi:hypothetical protein
MAGMRFHGRSSGLYRYRVAAVVADQANQEIDGRSWIGEVRKIRQRRHHDAGSGSTGLFTVRAWSSSQAITCLRTTKCLRYRRKVIFLPAKWTDANATRQLKVTFVFT